MKEVRFFIYARKSTDDLSRQLRSIEDQIAELKALAEREGLLVVDVLTEKQTAKEPGRPVFNAMLDRIEAGDAEAILAWHPDRLSRNGIDAARIISLVEHKQIQSLRFPTFPFDPTAAGKFMLNIIFAQSQYYVDNLSENIKRGQRQKLLKGIWPKMPPIGYLNEPRSKTIVPEPKRAPIIRTVFELFATANYTYDDITAEGNRLGLTSRDGKPLSRAQYHRMLRNPIYAGLLRYNDELHLGAHEALVQKALFDAVQEAIGARRRSRQSKFKPYIYRKLFRCAECGAMITTETQKGLNYLRCTRKLGPCSQPFVREELIAGQVDEILASVAVPLDQIDSMEESLADERALADATAADDKRAIEQSLHDLDLQISRLTTAYTANVLTLEELKREKAALVSQMANLRERAKALDRDTLYWLEPTLTFLKALREATVLVSSDETAKKAELLRKTGSNLRIGDRRIAYDFRGPWKTVAAYAPFGEEAAIARHRRAASGARSARFVSAAESVRRRSKAPSLVSVLTSVFKIGPADDAHSACPHTSPHRGEASRSRSTLQLSRSIPI